MNLQEALTIIGGLSSPSKMPCASYNLPATSCKTGSKMRDIKGTICGTCYARKGRYGFPNVKCALSRRLEALSNPEWYDAMVVVLEHTTKNNKFFRWHDSGDLQSVEHFDMVCELARQFPTVKFWLPTQEWNTIIVKSQQFDCLPKNLTIRRSAMFFDEFPDKDSTGLYSAVATSKGLAEAEKGGHAICQAPLNEGKCGNCRKCWDKNVKCITYHKH